MPNPTPAPGAAKENEPCWFEEWQKEFKAQFEQDYHRPMTNLELWISGQSYNAGKNRDAFIAANRPVPKESAPSEDAWRFLYESALKSDHVNVHGATIKELIDQLRSALANQGIPGERVIEVIENEPELLGPMPKEVAALIEEKGIEVAIRAAAVATKHSILRNVRAVLDAPAGTAKEK